MVADFRNTILKNFPHTPSQDQIRAIDALSTFIAGMSPSRIFIMRGYAGTGKTLLVTAITNALKRRGINSILLAPTYTTALNLSQVVKQPTKTIQEQIYKPVKNRNHIPEFALKQDAPKETVYIIDEAHLIPSRPGEDERFIFGGKGLLADFFAYAFSSAQNRIIFIGDPAHLPPGGEPKPGALSPDILAINHSQNADVANLYQVKTQSIETTPLLNASYVRYLIETGYYDERLILDLYKPNLRIIEQDDLIQAISMAYAEWGAENVAVIVKSNQVAVAYNKGIRREIFGYSSEINVDDRVVVVRNNYVWQNSKKGIPYLTRGQVGRITKLGAIEELDHFGFCEATLEFKNSRGKKVNLSGKILLNTLTSPTPALADEQWQTLFYQRRSSFATLTEEKEQALLRSDPYVNALQIKYAYAITGHNAIGKQYDHVFLNMEQWGDPNYPVAAYKWLYTSLTRSRNQLSLIDVPPHNVRHDVPGEVVAFLDPTQEDPTDHISPIPELEAPVQLIQEPASTRVFAKEELQEKPSMSEPIVERLPINYWKLFSLLISFLFLVAVSFSAYMYVRFKDQLFSPAVAQATLPSNTQTDTPISNPTDGTPSPGPSSTAPATLTIMPSSGVEGCISVPSSRVRSGPGTQYSLFGGVLYGDCFVFNGISADGEWLHIAEDIEQEQSGGWIPVAYVDIQGDYFLLPEMTPLPTPTIKPTFPEDE